MSEKQVQIGWATKSITPDRPVLVQGQLYSRVSQYVLDPITVTALAIENGAEQAIFVSMDMAKVDEHQSTAFRKAVDGIDGIDASKITFSATHTHNSSVFQGNQHREPNAEILGTDIVADIEVPDDVLMGEEAAAFLLEKISSLILEAWRARKPGGISSASDYAAVAFNRRPMFQQDDGTLESKMYGAASLDNFVRFEGTADHTIDMLYTWDMERNLTGVLVDVPCPSQVYELHDFITADYWTPTRSLIREKLGQNVFVLPICGAGGDQNPIDLVRISKDNEKTLVEWNAQAGPVFRNFDMALECQGIGERISDAVMRGLKRARNTVETAPKFAHAVKQVSLPLRLVSKEDYEEASALIKEKTAGYGPDNRLSFPEQVKLFEPVGVVARWQLQQKTTEVTYQMNVVRIGPAVIATNPFELFVEYGMRIRARAKAKHIFLCQLTNSSFGYLPTHAALAGGSYSSKPASTKVGPEGGDRLVEITLDTIAELMK